MYRFSPSIVYAVDACMHVIKARLSFTLHKSWLSTQILLTYSAAKKFFEVFKRLTKNEDGFSDEAIQLETRIDVILKG